MFLRSTNRKKDGKDHRYFSIVENRRVPGGRTVQWTVLYLGEINDQQQAAWRKTLPVFDKEEQRYTTLSLFPDDREIPADALDSVQVRLSGLELRRPRMFGNCWLGCELWHELGLDEFGQERLPEGCEAVSWEKVLRLLVVNRLLKPGSEFHLHRQWFVDSAMDELLETDFVVAEKDRLYRCRDRVLKHQQDLFVWLKQKWAPGTARAQARLPRRRTTGAAVAGGRADAELRPGARATYLADHDADEGAAHPRQVAIA
jgi:hypothetical protein